MAEPGNGHRRWAGLVVLLAVLLAGGGYGLHWYRVLRFWETTDDAFSEGTLLLISARVPGMVSVVDVDENQAVRAGERLLQLETRDFEIRVARARAALDAARNRMAAAHAAAEAADADRRAAEIELDRAESEARRVQKLFRSGAASEQLRENANAVRDAARARVRAFEERVLAERAVLGNEAPVKQAEAALREAERALSYTTITAPRDGIVGPKNASAGENVGAGQPLLALVANGPAWVIANFKETQIGHMRVGSAAEIRFAAYPDQRWRGHVESLSPATGAKYALLPPENATGNFTKVVQRVPARIALDELLDDAHGGPSRPEELAVGLSAEIRVRVGDD